MPLNHHRIGSGEPLVLIHGIGSQWQMWAPVFDRLEPQRDVIAIDLPGFGESPELPADVKPTPQNLAGAVVELFDELGLDTPAVAGNSLGGWVAMELARRGRARTVAAIDPAGFWLPREHAYSTASLWVHVRGARLVASTAPGLPRNPIARTALFPSVMAKPWRMSPEEAVGAMKNLARSPGYDSTLDVLGQMTFCGGDEIRVPVTVVWGTRDVLLFPRQAERAARVLPNSRIHWLRGAGHVPTWDAPDEVARVLVEL